MARKYDIFDQEGQEKKQKAKDSTSNENQADEMQVDGEATDTGDTSHPSAIDEADKPANNEQPAVSRSQRTTPIKVADLFVEGFMKLQKEYKADPLLTRFKLHMPINIS
ncbi:hypothetical protein PtA15_12A565 [Puccinia triticina]|uniref:Uncharacterized protein n=1 Tax=Puccinia triticina TaxID=208348 RepID=A0ABY7D3J7_9BASI|nr:uncharacterized protein PtA15_12A565 [Puccinia triticina]WAQ90575.1 hypothetical protein PtA15_12A565 [Puccinia triticina]WAR61887.1 hypothetical protein PtB15_12B579 [Puccinia triticina]